MKKGYSPLQLFGEILLVLIILLILIAFISPLYRETFVNGIKKIFGYEIESEVIHEKNVQAQDEFKLLRDKIDRCKKVSKSDCGCDFNVNNYNENHMIVSTINDISMINIGKIDKKAIINNKENGVLIEKYDIQNTNCFFDGKINRIDKVRIFFDKEKPYIYEKRGGIFVKNEISLNSSNPLYKDSAGNICWLSNKITNIKSCQ